MKKVMVIFGTRPEAIKMAPLVKAIEADGDLRQVVVVTAQHREMLDQVLELFAIKPDYDLNLMKANQTLTDVTAGVLRGIERVIIKEKPDLVLVHGDTTTTFAGALAAFYQQIAIGHVEAGLRSGDLYSPFPEEANRSMTGVLSTLHFAPTREARSNLLRENVAAEAIYVTGNTVIDALKTTVQQGYTFTDPGITACLAQKGPKILLTTHRRENQGQPMVDIFRGIRRLHDDLPECGILFPMHKNPRVRALAQEALADCPRVFMIEPLDYEPFVNVMARVDLVLTDSGGLQEEAPALGKPVLVLRDNTERPEAVAAGTVMLVGSDTELIYGHAYKLLTDPLAYEAMERAVNPYGDGLASSRILAGIRHHFGLDVARPINWQE